MPGLPVECRMEIPNPSTLPHNIMYIRTYSRTVAMSTEMKMIRSSYHSVKLGTFSTLDGWPRTSSSHLRGVKRGIKNVMMITCCQPRLRDKLSSQTLRTLRVLRWRGICGEALLLASNSRCTTKCRPCSFSSCKVTASASSSSSLLHQRRYDSSSRDSTSDKKESKETKQSKESEDEKSGKKEKHKPLLLSQSNTTRLKNDKLRQKQQQAEDDRQEYEAIKATSIGALANVCLATSKGVIGYTINSTGLMADAANSAGDLLIDGVVLYTIKEARKKATPERPWGRGKIEPLGALTIGGVLLATGGGIGYAAIAVMLEMFASWQAAEGLVNVLPSPQEIEAATLAADASFRGVSFMQGAALLISSLSIVSKEALYHYTLHVGEESNSDSVKANAWQHRSDACVSVAVLVGLAGSLNGLPLLDPMAGILVAGVIVKQGLTQAQTSLKDLSDIPADQDETEILKATCMKVPGILSISNLQARQSGPFLYVECTVGVPGNISASAAHRLAELARNAMMTRPPPYTDSGHVSEVAKQMRVANAVVHVDPIGSTGMGEKSPDWARDHDNVAIEVKKSILGLDPDITDVSEVQVYYRDDGRLVLKVDVVMRPELTIKAAHKLAIRARDKIQKDLPGVASVDVDLELNEGDEEDDSFHSRESEDSKAKSNSASIDKEKEKGKKRDKDDDRKK